MRHRVFDSQTVEPPQVLRMVVRSLMNVLGMVCWAVGTFLILAPAFYGQHHPQATGHGMWMALSLIIVSVWFPPILFIFGLILLLMASWLSETRRHALISCCVYLLVLFAAICVRSLRAS